MNKGKINKDIIYLALSLIKEGKTIPSKCIGNNIPCYKCPYSFDNNGHRRCCNELTAKEVRNIGFKILGIRSMYNE